MCHCQQYKYWMHHHGDATMHCLGLLFSALLSYTCCCQQQETHWGLHVKYLVLSDLKQIWIFFTDCNKSFLYQTSQNLYSGSWADRCRWMERHDETNGHLQCTLLIIIKQKGFDSLTTKEATRILKIVIYRDKVMNTYYHTTLLTIKKLQTFSAKDTLKINSLKKICFFITTLL